MGWVRAVAVAVVAIGSFGVAQVAAASSGQLSQELVGPPSSFVAASSPAAINAVQPVEAALGSVTPFSSPADAVWTGESGTLVVLLARTPGVIASTVPAAVADAVCESATKAKAVSTSPMSSLPGAKASCAQGISIVAFSKPAVDVIAVVSLSASPHLSPATGAELLTRVSDSQYEAIGAPKAPSVHVASTAVASHKKQAGVGGLLSLLVLVALLVGGAYLVVRRRRHPAAKTAEQSDSIVAVPPVAQPLGWSASGDATLASAPWDASPSRAERVSLSPAETPPTFGAATVSPGWHPDPSDELVRRYWDGTEWTRTIRWDQANGAWVTAVRSLAPPQGGTVGQR